MPADHPAFRLSMQTAGLVPPDGLLIEDGRIHRCSVEGKKRSNRSGAYSITADGRFGGFQNWAAGTPWQSWRAELPADITPAQRAAIQAEAREATAKRLAEEKRLAEAARLKAIDMWSKAVEGPHPYLDRKGICSNGSRTLGKLLLVPLCDWGGALHTLQIIRPDGQKFFLKGGSPKGRFHWIRIGKQLGPVIYVVEGFATGATIHAATGGRPVVVAFNCGNLMPVAYLLRQLLPRVRIVVCSDNDHETVLPDGTKNPGLTKATEAAAAVRARIAVPWGMAGTDFNDLFREHGIEEVKRQLAFTEKPW